MGGCPSSPRLTFLPRLETLITSATYTNPPMETVLAGWPADVDVTGALADWLIYRDVGEPLVPTGLTVVAGELQLTHETIVAPDFPTFLELVNPASIAADVDSLFLATGGKFPIVLA